MLKDTPDGQTHYYGDGCKEHPIEDRPKHMTKDTWREELQNKIQIKVNTIY